MSVIEIIRVFHNKLATSFLIYPCILIVIATCAFYLWRNKKTIFTKAGVITFSVLALIACLVSSLMYVSVMNSLHRLTAKFSASENQSFLVAAELEMAAANQTGYLPLLVTWLSIMIVSVWGTLLAKNRPVLKGVLFALGVVAFVTFWLDLFGYCSMGEYISNLKAALPR